MHASSFEVCTRNGVFYNFRNYADPPFRAAVMAKLPLHSFTSTLNFNSLTSKTPIQVQRSARHRDSSHNLTVARCSLVMGLMLSRSQGTHATHRERPVSRHRDDRKPLFKPGRHSGWQLPGAGASTGMAGQSDRAHHPGLGGRRASEVQVGIKPPGPQWASCWVPSARDSEHSRYSPYALLTGITIIRPGQDFATRAGARAGS